MRLSENGAARAVLLAVALCGLVALIVWAVRRTSPMPAVGRAAPGADCAAARERMVSALRREGLVETERVAAAMLATERHLFVPSHLRDVAYADRPLPIGEDQTISAPGVVAKMTELLRPQPGDTVLEVGTGSGYQAAVLAPLVAHVYTIEIVPALAESAERRLAALGYANVTVRYGDGYRGWPEHAPFDAVIVTCAPDAVPEPLLEQLAEGGRMVIPVGEERGMQWLYLLTKRDGLVMQERSLPVRFVPMTGEAGG